MAVRGRGQFFPEDPNKVSWRYNALPNIEGTILVEGEMDDTGTSPAKKAMDIDPNLHSDALDKRRLELGEDEESADDQTCDISKTTSNHDMNVDGPGQKTITLGTEKEN
jgi:hypothetical protein